LFILFIDYKNAYNTIKWDHLFQTLDQVYTNNPSHAQFIKALYLHTKLRIGNITITPNRGLMQGSILSPLLFNLCLDPILKIIQLELNLSISQILAFADDIAFICDSLNQVEDLIELLEKESPKIGLMINKSKSAVLEVCCRKYARPKWTLEVGNFVKGFPIVNEYTYLGISIDRKLSLDCTFKAIKLSSFHTILNLQPIILNSSIDLRVNLWNTLIKPLLEMGAIPYLFSQKSTEIGKIESLIKKTQKMCLGFPKRGEDKYLNFLLLYNWNERCNFIGRRPKYKWLERQGGMSLNPPKECALKKIDIKYLPRTFMTLIKLIGGACKYCGAYRVDPKHLIKIHCVDIQEFDVFQVYYRWKEKKNWREKNREETLLLGEQFISRYINILTPHLLEKV